MRYAQIRSMDISNGEGVGVALFVQGCNFHCNNCFNKETWDFNGGKEWTDEIQEKLLNLIKKPHIKRVSILGGEPLDEKNAKNVLNFANQIRLLFGDEKKIWLYTGYTYENAIKDETRKAVINQCDVLVDGQFVEALKDFTLKFRGSSNQRLIDVKETLKKGQVVTL